MFRQALRQGARRTSRRITPNKRRGLRASRRVLSTTTSWISNENPVPAREQKRPYNVGTLHPSMTSGSVTVAEPPFKKLMAGNRGEIATRICRGAAELGIQTVGIYSHEGTYSRTLPSCGKWSWNVGVSEWGIMNTGLTHEGMLIAHSQTLF